MVAGLPVDWDWCGVFPPAPVGEYSDMMKSAESAEPIAREAFDELAERYAALAPTKAHNAYYEWPATRSLLAEVRGKRVLDAGCGPGHYAEWLLERGAEVVGVDVSPQMIRLARERLGGRAEFYLADLGRPLSFLADESFDVVLGALVFDYVRDWNPLFAEFRRLLRAGGVLVFSAGHPLLDYLQRGTGSYFTTELITFTWRGFGGEPVDVPTYRRPLSAITEALTGSGFVIERILEPRPTDEFKSADPESYEQLSRLPGFICFRARRGC